MMDGLETLSYLGHLDYVVYGILRVLTLIPSGIRVTIVYEGRLGRHLVGVLTRLRLCRMER
jgi:hypothetical protein